MSNIKKLTIEITVDMDSSLAVLWGNNVDYFQKQVAESLDEIRRYPVICCDKEEIVLITGTRYKTTVTSQ